MKNVLKIFVGCLVMGGLYTSAIAKPVPDQRPQTILWLPTEDEVNTDAKFVAYHTQSLETQARLCQVALQKSKSITCRDFAQAIIARSNNASHELRTIACAQGLRSGPVLDLDHQWAVTSISDLPKAVFNQAYISELARQQAQQISALEMRPGTVSPSLAAWAERRLSEIREDLTAANSIDTKQKQTSRTAVASTGLSM